MDIGESLRLAGAPIVRRTNSRGKLMTRTALLLAALFAASAAQAADPVKIGITTVLSGPTADRGQSEQYGVQLALDQINEAGGVLERPIEAFYVDNACKPDI